MPFKPNYGQQRAERNRLKRERAEEKQKAREQQIAERKAGRPEGSPEDVDQEGSVEQS